MNLAEPILSEACPFCSRFKKDHPDVLLEDVLVIPSIYPGRHRSPLEKFTRWYISKCCIHAADLRGPHNSEEIAKQAWSERVEKLRAEKEQKRQELEQSLVRINEGKTRPSLAIAACSPAGVGKERSDKPRNEPQQLAQPATESRASDRAHREAETAGGAGCSVGNQDAVSGLCEVGNQIWSSHDLDIHWKCKRCGHKVNL